MRKIKFPIKHLEHWWIEIESVTKGRVRGSIWSRWQADERKERHRSFDVAAKDRRFKISLGSGCSATFTVPQ
jgi:phosphoribosylaminoimidazole-succinocarboxamide synthase